MTSTLIPEGQDAKAGSGSPFSRSKAETVAELRRGLHYPRSIGEFQAWFRTDADCLDYLDWLRWPHGFECAKCDGVGGWRTCTASLRWPSGWLLSTLQVGGRARPPAELPR